MPLSLAEGPSRLIPTRHPAVSRSLTAAAIAVVAVVGCIVLWQPMQPAPTVDLDVVNTTDRAIHVSIRAQGERAVIGLGTVPRDSTASFLEVVEVGDRWVIEFSSAGVEGGEITMTRSQLVEAGWTVTVPERLDRVLAAAGVPAAA